MRIMQYVYSSLFFMYPSIPDKIRAIPFIIKIRLVNMMRTNSAISVFKTTIAARPIVMNPIKILRKTAQSLISFDVYLASLKFFS